MFQIVCVSDTGTGLNLIRVDVLNESWLDNIHEGDTPEIRSASDMKLAVFGTITLRLCTSKVLTRVTFSVVE